MLNWLGRTKTNILVHGGIMRDKRFSTIWELKHITYPSPKTFFVTLISIIIFMTILTILIFGIDTILKTIMNSFY